MMLHRWLSARAASAAWAVLLCALLTSRTDGAVQILSAAWSGGNGNGAVDANECDFLQLVITNTTGGPLTGISATLLPLTPAVSVTSPTAAFPNLATGARGTNLTPFQVSFQPGLVPGTNVQFTLQLQGAPFGTESLPLIVSNSFVSAVGQGGCESCPEQRVIYGVLGNGSLLQDGRIARDLVPSFCGVEKICPGPNSLGFTRRYDAYVFENGESNTCITVTLTAGCDLFSVAYLGSYNPTNLCLNYLADMGDSTINGHTNYSFTVAARARFVVVVNGVNGTTSCGYRLAVDGGSCRPLLGLNPIAANRVVLDWSTSALGYALEQTNRLANTPAPLWIAVTNVPAITNSRFSVTLTNSVASTNRFFRLHKP